MGKVQSICWLYRINFGGVETRAKNIANNLARAYPVEMLYAGNFFSGKEGGNLFREKSLFLWKNPYKDKKHSKIWWEKHFIQKATNYLKKQKNDILFCDGQGINAIPGINMSIPTVTTVHGLHGWLPPGHLEKKTLNRANLIIAITNNTRNRLIEHGVDKKKISTVYNGINYYKIKHSETDTGLLSKYRLNHKKIILTVHNFVEKKNVLRTLTAFQTLSFKNNNYQMVLIGDGALKKKAELFVKQKGISNVHFLGRLKQEVIFKFYKLAELFVLPSTENESWGIVFIEAMAAGCPVITSSYCGVSEILKHKKHAYILKNPYDQDEINNALFYTIESDNLKQNLSNNGKELARKFDWQTKSQEYLDIVKDKLKVLGFQ